MCVYEWQPNCNNNKNMRRLGSVVMNNDQHLKLSYMKLSMTYCA